MTKLSDQPMRAQPVSLSDQPGQARELWGGLRPRANRPKITNLSLYVSAFIEEGCRERAVPRRWPGLRADGGSPILVCAPVFTRSRPDSA